MSFVLFRDAECGRPSPNQPTYLSLGKTVPVPLSLLTHPSFGLGNTIANKGSSSTGGSGNEGGEGSGGSSSEGVGQGGGEYTGAPWYHPPPTFPQGSNAVAAQADAATGTEGFAGVNLTGACTQFKGQSIGSVQFACPEFARQPGPTATSTSGGGESLRVQSRSRSYGAVWWTMMGGWVVLRLLGGG
ncbi:hypothetical protein PG997_003476 [Apiospora hydei]|uniref:Uncharacterized protein n=1 Tax=Apiospora hydei TaxID=1337664 RepID=A0ABR1WZF3_9PEZI